MYSTPSKKKLEKSKSLSRHKKLESLIISFDKAKSFYNYNPEILIHGGRINGSKILSNINDFKNMTRLIICYH